MRVYCEDQLMDDLVGDNPYDVNVYYVTYIPSAIRDANKCKEDIVDKKTKPSDHRKRSFEALVNFLVDGLQE
eukprot:11265988-Ditylum_brightwellii.AAC.1